MCGITGKVYLCKDRFIDPNELKLMTDSIQHRGPDDEGFYINQNVGLGFRRLSIIDLNTGHQPLSDTADTMWIVFNASGTNTYIATIPALSSGVTYRAQFTYDPGAITCHVFNTTDLGTFTTQ